MPEYDQLVDVALNNVAKTQSAGSIDQERFALVSIAASLAYGAAMIRDESKAERERKADLNGLCYKHADAANTVPCKIPGCDQDGHLRS